jgi:hypothetical protein
VRARGLEMLKIFHLHCFFMLGKKAYMPANRLYRRRTSPSRLNKSLSRARDAADLSGAF